MLLNFAPADQNQIRVEAFSYFADNLPRASGINNQLEFCTSDSLQLVDPFLCHAEQEVTQWIGRLVVRSFFKTRNSVDELELGALLFGKLAGPTNQRDVPIFVIDRANYPAPRPV